MQVRNSSLCGGLRRAFFSLPLTSSVFCKNTLIGLEFTLIQNDLLSCLTLIISSNTLFLIRTYSEVLGGHRFGGMLFNPLRSQESIFVPLKMISSLLRIPLPWWPDGKSVCLQCGRPGFDPWFGKIPWRRKWQPTPVFLPGKSHGQRSLTGYSPWGRKELDMTEQLHFDFSLS